jgi:SAM-dependent methyltransferase
MTEAVSPPRQDWAGEMGERWQRHHLAFESMIAPAGDAVLAAAAFRSGERVLDVGCGAGQTCLAIAERVGVTGHVTGLDLSPLLVATARERVTTAGSTTIDFLLGDAATAAPGPDPYHCVFSRFGVMFFDDPYRAFRNLRRFLRADGRLVFICWGSPSENPWASLLLEIARRYVALPPPVPRTPGPFALADPEYLRDILASAGFNAIEIVPWHGMQRVGGAGATAHEAARFACDALFIGEALADQPQDVKDRARADAVEVLAAYHGAAGVEVPAAAWLVTARPC